MTLASLVAGTVRAQTHRDRRHSQQHTDYLEVSNLSV